MWDVTVSSQSSSLLINESVASDATTRFLQLLSSSFKEDLPPLIASLLQQSSKSVQLVIEVSITFVDDDDMRNLNREYRDKDKTTDVLSFPQFSNEELDEGSFFREIPPLVSLGDIVISLPMAAIQAEEFGCTVTAEILRLLAHGLLHLLGFDHEDVSHEVAEQMRFLETRMLSVEIPYWENRSVDGVTLVG